MPLIYKLLDPSSPRQLWDKVEEDMRGYYPQEYPFPNPYKGHEVLCSAAFDERTGKCVAALFVQPVAHIEPLIITDRKRASYQRLYRMAVEKMTSEIPEGETLFLLAMPEGPVTQKMCIKQKMRKLRDVECVYELALKGEAKPPGGQGSPPQEDPESVFPSWKPPPNLS